MTKKKLKVMTRVKTVLILTMESKKCQQSMRIRPKYYAKKQSIRKRKICASSNSFMTSLEFKINHMLRI